MSTPKQKSPQNKTKKRTVWPIVSLLIIIALFTLLIVLGYNCRSSVCHTFLVRIITTFLNNRPYLFNFILFPLCAITLCFALFQKTHKWIYFGFFTSLTFIITLAGQVLDYITRPDVSVHTHDVLGTAYGDYGLGSSSYDLDESYNYPNRSQNTSSKDTSSEDYSKQIKNLFIR